MKAKDYKGIEDYIKQKDIEKKKKNVERHNYLQSEEMR